MSRPFVADQTDRFRASVYNARRSVSMTPQLQRAMVAIGGRARGSIVGRPWWGEYILDESAYTRLVREIEVAKGRITSHEKECTVRYSNIEASMTDIKSDVTAILCKVDAQTAGANKWLLGVATAIILMLLGGLGWSTGQVYQLQTQRVEAAVSK